MTTTIDRLALAISRDPAGAPISLQEARRFAYAVVEELDDEMALEQSIKDAGFNITEYATDAFGDMLKTILEQDRLEHGVIGRG